MYRIVPDDSTMQQVAQLPVEALDSFAEVLTVLEVTPWNGAPQHVGNPDGAVRRWHFGSDLAGQVVYLVLEDQREVHLLLVQWLG
ncbi:hypothetical protein ACFQ1S_32395 [Kibdelosporangium lantanae]|uniref:Type II toxin-antitoxin system RelE/ParE family toxin n=1 Tax=Kibdelosporangium lantanae TaxID=1497396 RepID=A0ABW3MLC8_9PSEU